MALINDFLSLIYPRYCEACGRHLFKHERHLCKFCLLNLPKSAFHLDPLNSIAFALGGRVPLEKVLCLYLFEKSGKVQKLIHAIKYQDQKDLAVFLGQLMAEEFKKSVDLIPFDLVIPIPLHKNKLKKRGYNQSEYYAKGLSDTLKCSVESSVLERISDSSTQTRKKKFARWENVEGIFHLKDAETLRNKHVLLVDDVITTGATIDSAWQSLTGVEGIKISVACIAYARKN